MWEVQLCYDGEVGVSSFYSYDMVKYVSQGRHITLHIFPPVF